MRQGHTVNVVGGRDAPRLSAVWLLCGLAGLGTDVCVLVLLPGCLGRIGGTTGWERSA